MINSNFTYGIFEEVRDQWINNVVDICQENNIDFFISKHPRDNGVFRSDFEVLESGAFQVNDQIRRSTILISRFSTLIYEALCMGRRAIYYNPHQEPFRIFSEDDTKGIFIAQDKAALKKGILESIANSDQNEENVAKFLQLHCNLSEGNIGSVERIRDELIKISMTERR